MPKRTQFSLPDDVAATLEKLAEDCSLPQSVVIAQLVRRYHPQLRQLLAIDCNLLQPTATSTPTQSVYPSEGTQDTALLSSIDESLSQQDVLTSQSIAPGDAFLAMEF
jgi:hypothetical protein